MHWRITSPLDITGAVSYAGSTLISNPFFTRVLCPVDVPNLCNDPGILFDTNPGLNIPFLSGTGSAAAVARDIGTSWGQMTCYIRPVRLGFNLRSPLVQKTSSKVPVAVFPPFQTPAKCRSSGCGLRLSIRRSPWIDHLIRLRKQENQRHPLDQQPGWQLYQ